MIDISADTRDRLIGIGLCVISGIIMSLAIYGAWELFT